ncbi:IQ domain-containing protein K isoform X1 [Sciurus carolinensis]|uniref:IQ domain-containing protein K isoform X1 n=1 Tax=Sciurus carolinensis TaxID=30640 RepID=UPI001FB2E459|nr:IQ domain-containing protein K isoform X1 [Sciurus carolinensis]
MALAPRQASSRSVQRVEPSGSTESSVTTRTPVPTLSSPPPELSVSPGQVAELSSKTLWEQICEEYQAELPPFPKGYEVKQEPEITVSPPEETVSHGFKIEHYFPPPPLTRVSHVPCPLKVSETVDPKTCSPRKYLETYIFPVLLPGMTSLLHQAKKEKCFEVPVRPSDLGAAPPRRRRAAHRILWVCVFPVVSGSTVLCKVKRTEEWSGSVYNRPGSAPARTPLRHSAFQSAPSAALRGAFCPHCLHPADEGTGTQGFEM